MEKKVVTKKIIKPLTPAQFKKLSVKGKRIAIAKDVIAQVKSKVYIATQGSYIRHIKINDEYKYWEDINTEDIQSILPSIGECSVCAMGSCIMSITKYENKLKFRDVNGPLEDFSKKTDNVIKDMFTPEQFCLMEIMFEGRHKLLGNGIDNYGSDRLKAKITEEQALKAGKFCRRYKNDNNRLIAIMQHIIDQKGEINL